jgi:hypothetical protein
MSDTGSTKGAAGYDIGYVFSSPHIAESSKMLKTGRILVANHQAGVVISENPDSHWHRATFLSQGTTIQDAEGKTLGDAALCEFVDADGDLSWYDTGYSFHGPHVVRATKTLSNGLVLGSNSQSGVLVSENPDSPFHHGVSVGRGTTIKSLEGKVLGDVMIGETIDADGDMVWNYHTWWCAEGGGSYGIIGGTGKWEAITGVGKTLGLVRQRADDHFMLRWEAHWRVDR